MTNRTKQLWELAKPDRTTHLPNADSMISISTLLLDNVVFEFTGGTGDLFVEGGRFHNGAALGTVSVLLACDR